MKYLYYPTEELNQKSGMRVLIKVITKQKKGVYNRKINYSGDIMNYKYSQAIIIIGIIILIYCTLRS